MRRTAVIAGAAGAVIVLSGGIAMAFDGQGVSPGSAGRTTMTSSASPEAEAGTPTDDSSTTPSPSPSASATPSARSATPSAPTAPTAIDRAEAERIALRTVPGGRIESVERETEHGRAVWDVDVIAGGTEHDVDVDAMTGKVLRHKTDHDKGHDDKGDDRGHGQGHDDRGHDDRGHDDN